MKLFGYARVSTPTQVLARQINGINKYAAENFPDCKPEIYSEKFTGATNDRPAFNTLKLKVKKVVEANNAKKASGKQIESCTIIFDEISRMSRNSEEGFTQYKEWLEAGVDLVFLKEHTLDTHNFRETQRLSLVGNEIADIYIDATNKVLTILLENQIRSAFSSAEHERVFNSLRTSDSMRNSHAGDKISKSKTGKKVIHKCEMPAKEEIRKHCIEFGGTLSDPDVIKLSGVSRNTFYRYKKQIRDELSENGGKP